MKEFSPKPDLWSKIQQRKDFDSQVKEHAPNLLVKMPKADLWGSIESKLDQKTPEIPIWKYGMAAASIALILALSGIAYLQFDEKEVKSPLVTEVSIPITQLKTVDKNQEGEPGALKTELNKPVTPLLDTPRKTSPLRKTIAPIELPELNLEDLRLENTFVSDLIIPPATVAEAPKTLHQVSISWSKIKPKMQITTGFGRKESEWSKRQQASSEQKAHITLEINN